MVVYLDLVLLLNFVIDASLIAVTAWVRKQPLRLWRMTLASAIGASYVGFMLVPELSFMYTFAAKAAISVAMALTAFGYGGARRFFRTLGVFYLTTFAAAGTVLGIHYFWMSSNEVWNGVLVSQGMGQGFMLRIGPLLLIFGVPAAIWLYMRVHRQQKQQELVGSYLAEVEVEVEQYRYRCKGLIDTGNHLYDPLTKTPVMIMEANGWRDVIPDAWIESIRKADADRIVASGDADGFPWRDRLRLVPYRGVNRGTQFMLAIKPDRVIVSHGDKQIETGRVLVGFDGGTLSADGAYQAIIHPTLVEAQQE